MPHFVLYIATTLDGYIARSNGSIDWLSNFEVAGEDYGYADFYTTIDSLVMGSATYEQVLGFGEWVYPGKISYVLTRRECVSDRNDIVFVKGGIAEVVDRVTQRGDRRVWVVGGGKVASQFIQQGWVDEYIIAVMPIILGAGISLFQNVPELRLNLIHQQSYASGVVMLHYRS